MQFVANGPDIPDTLLEAHEDGRVVFFCGAGISYPAGLPGFKGLVNEIYRLVGTTRTPIEDEAYARDHFDATLDLLERRLPGGRIAVRSALAKVLQPKLRRKRAADTHVALLHLACCREGALRLVTTNFDRVFEHVAKRTLPSLNTYAAPMLPIPKNSRWDGVVYLHGLLPNKQDESALHRLVLTSGDFGLAYLTERWAARFVSELFRNYVVCFVGYSINDPVLRYMMDALAADRMLGEATPQAFALGDCAPGHEEAKRIEWKAKGVSPILYEVPTGSHDHSTLHHTLAAWSETYRNGVLGKERIVVDYALARPSASSRQDDFVGRMLWALSHQSGLPARRFADFNPAPPIEWLEAFSEDRFLHLDLSRFGVPPRHQTDKKLRFSVMRRPAPYDLAPRMALVCGGVADSQWDDVMFQLARWLVRHLNDPALIIWLAEGGGQLHDRMAVLIESELDRISRFERQGNTTELAQIRANSPNAIPRPLIRVLWRLLLTGRVKSPRREFDLYRWRERLNRDGLTTTLRLELREMLAPKVALKKPFRWSEEETEDAEESDGDKNLKQLVDWELVLAADHVHSTFADLGEAEPWLRALPTLLDDFQVLLRDALDLLSELGEAEEHRDSSHWELPSIAPHWQNRTFRDWVALIELLRDAWLATHRLDAAHATQIAYGWFALPYSTFKRLALFAASQDDCIPADRWVDWLTTDSSWWLWVTDTHRETMRLLVLQGSRLSAESRGKLEAAILQGPPRAMYKDDIGAEGWESIVAHSVWLRLAKLHQGSNKLGADALIRFNELSTANPVWRMGTNEREEFTHWMSGSGDPDYEDNRDVDIAPRKRSDLVAWLKQPSPDRRPFYEDTWGETCRSRFFHSLYALCDLASEGIWPKDRWREALQAWSEESRLRRSWRFAAPLVESMPADVFAEIAHGVAWWLQAASKSIDTHVGILLTLCNRVLGISHRDGVVTDQPVTRAINHPIGQVTQALLNLWFSRKPNDNDALPDDVRPMFTRLCDISVEQFRHGRVVLASRLIALFRVDRAWTEEYLLPLLNWSASPEEARATWEGFLWSPRLYPPLLIAFKEQFLSTAHHYGQLGEHKRQYAAFLTYAALEPVDKYSRADFQEAIAALPQEGLQEVAQSLSQALEGAGEQREAYWTSRIRPFWQEVWPKSRDFASANISESLARLSIAARGEFPSAIATVLAWLQPLQHIHHVLHLLHESGLARRFPENALELLNAVLDNQAWASPELGKCLETISQVSPSLRQDRRFLRLDEFARRRGG